MRLKKFKYKLNKYLLINYLIFVPIITSITYLKMEWLYERKIGDIWRYKFFIESNDASVLKNFEFSYQILVKLINFLDINPSIFFAFLTSLIFLIIIEMSSNYNAKKTILSTLTFTFIFYILPPNFQAISNILSTWRASLGYILFLTSLSFIEKQRFINQVNYKLNVIQISKFIWIILIFSSTTHLSISILLLSLIIFKNYYLDIVNLYKKFLSRSILKLRKNFLKVKKIFLKNNILYFFLGLLIIIFLRLSAKFYFLRRIGHYIGEGNDLFFNAILSLTYITFSYLIMRILSNRERSIIFYITFLSCLITIPLIFLSPSAFYRYLTTSYIFIFIYLISDCSQIIFKKINKL